MNIAPLEELFVLKAKMNREKDRNDLRSLNNKEFDREFLLELIDDWGLEREDILSRLNKAGIDT